MFLMVTLLGFGLLSSVKTLTCYQCSSGSSGNCTDSTVECLRKDHRCATTRTISYTDGSETRDRHEKQCALPKDCTEVSVSYPRKREVINMECCDTDRCNSKPAKKPSNRPNGLRCYHCEDSYCNVTAYCVGIEDHCFNYTRSSGSRTTIVMGCASKWVCDPNVGSSVWEDVRGIQCCQGDLCNTAVSVSASLLLLLLNLLLL